MDPQTLLFAGLAMVFGGVLKGAIGAGAPIVAVPLLALMVDVPFAVAIFVIPNILSNLWQWWQYRGHSPSGRLVWSFAGGGVLGVICGTFMLAYLSRDFLLSTVAGVVVIYIVMRVSRPGWVLARSIGERVSSLAGFVGGVLQGSGGISAPISITFLNSMKLSRAEFIATISVFFLVMGLVQLPMHWYLGIMDLERSILSLASAAVLLLGMQIGERLAKRISRETFDKVILVLLALIAVRLLVEAFY